MTPPSAARKHIRFDYGSIEHLPVPKRRQGPNPHIFHPQGDLYLLVGPDGLEYRVYSQVLIVYSKVFEKMLTGRWAESQPRPAGETWTIELPEDDPAAFKILLDIIHARPDEVPNKLDLEELFFVCVLADKYEMESHLYGWATQWTDHTLQVGKHIQHLWIAYVLGDHEMFERASMHVAWHGCKTIDGPALWTPPDDDDEEEDMDRTSAWVDKIGVLDDLAEVRKQALKIARDPYFDTWQIFKGADPMTEDLCLLDENDDRYFGEYPIESQRHCAMFTFQNFSSNMDPPDRTLYNPDDTEVSLAITLETIREATRGLMEPLRGHEYCDLGERFAEGVDEVGERIGSMVKEAVQKYKPHLDKQAKKTGHKRN